MLPDPGSKGLIRFFVFIEKGKPGMPLLAVTMGGVCPNA